MPKLFRRRPDLLSDVDDDVAPSWRHVVGRRCGELFDAWRGRAYAALWWSASLWRTADGEGRSWRRVAGALPAVVAGGGLILFAVVAHHRRAVLAHHYEAAARQAAEGGDADAAVLFRRRLGELGRTGDADRLRLAAALAAAGRDAEAFELLSGLLGGGDDPGYAPAHLLFAERLLAGPPDAGSGDAGPPDAGSGDAGSGDGTSGGADADAADRAGRRARALRHVAAALRSPAGGDAVKAKAASLLVAAGEPAAAAPLLEGLAGGRPEIWPDLVRLYAALGRPGDAARAAENAAPVLRRALARNPLDLTARVRLADALDRRGRFDDAVSVLAEGRSLHPGGDVPRLLAALHVAEYDRAVAARDGRLGRRLKLLERAIDHEPRFVPALERLANFADAAAAQARRGGSAPGVDAAPSVGEARELLNRLLATGEAPAGVHFALGLNALRSDDSETAAFHFDRAHQLDPALAEAANNLAFLLSKQEDPDLPRALALADAAVAAAPDHPQVRHTRGAILAALDRPDDALREYERAMERGLRGDPEVRREVADLYDRLGRPELADRFRPGTEAGSPE